MAKQKSLRRRSRVEQNAFVKGLITEASPLSFPDNASLAEENFVLNIDGTRQRRLGMDFENGGEITATANAFNQTISTDSYTWKDASNNRNFDIAVVKVDNLLYFFDGNAENVSASPLNLGQPIQIPKPINPIDVPLDIAGTYDFASINGYLVVTNNTNSIYIVSFDLDEHDHDRPSIQLDVDNIKVRDLFGIDEPDIPDSARPIVLTEVHKYNLRNQGWVDNIQGAYKGVVTSTLVDSVDYTFAEIGVYPSNADMIWANKTSGSPADPKAIGSYDPYELFKSTYNNREAPKGRYIIDLFERGASRSVESVNEGVVLPTEPKAEETVGGITAVSAYMGRAVFATTELRVVASDGESPAIGSSIYIGQAKDSLNALTKCHTLLDPTSGEDFASTAIDGGFVKISGLGQVLSLKEMSNSLLIFSDRGVWQINGGDRLFSMTNINLNKITDVGSISKNSVVVAEDKLVYLSDGGFYMIENIESDKKPRITNLTQTTIQSWYDAIPRISKIKSVNYYDRFTRKIKWLFALGVVPNFSYYDTELTYDLNIGAFSISRIKLSALKAQSPFLIGFQERPAIVTEQTSENVTVLGELVRVAENTLLQEDVTIGGRSESALVESSNKYWCMFTSGSKGRITVCEYNQNEFIDWNSFPEVAADAEAFLLTGHATAGESSTFKRIPYITTHMKRTEENLLPVLGGYDADNPSSCSLQVQWEWTDNPETGRWSNPQEIYRLPRTFIPDSPEFPYGFEVVTTKSKLRGRGRSFSLLFKTKPLHDCYIYGWSVELDAENTI